MWTLTLSFYTMPWTYSWTWMHNPSSELNEQFMDVRLASCLLFWAKKRHCFMRPKLQRCCQGGGTFVSLCVRPLSYNYKWKEQTILTISVKSGTQCHVGFLEKKRCSKAVDFNWICFSEGLIHPQSPINWLSYCSINNKVKLNFHLNLTRRRIGVSMWKSMNARNPFREAFFALEYTFPLLNVASPSIFLTKTVKQWPYCSYVVCSIPYLNRLQAVPMSA